MHDPGSQASRRGARVLASLVLFQAAALLTGFAEKARGADDDDARAVVEKAIRAHGGPENLTKLQTCRIKSKGTVDLSVAFGTQMADDAFGVMKREFETETFVQLPRQYKVIIDRWMNFSAIIGGGRGPKDLAATVVLNGDEGWIKTNGHTKSMNEEELKESKSHARELHAITLVPLLKDKEYKLSLLDEAKVKGKVAVGIRVKVEGLQALSL